ncbi:MAG TPA: restriction endonuclease [Candidatus Angelobacter sp.]|nr:restriction endonuclease [Candidatus Angelobacter sp.]
MAAVEQPKKQVWIVRAGKQAEMMSEFLSKGVIAVSWREVGNFEVKEDWPSFREEVKKHLPEGYSGQRVGAAAGQLWAFIHGIQNGDYVVSPDKHARQVHVGVVAGEYKYDPGFDEEYPRVRKVKWIKALDWDSLPTRQRQSFTAWQTIHQPETDFIGIIEAAQSGKVVQIADALDEPEEATKEDLAERAEEAIRELLRGIGYEDFQRLTGAVLKAAGFVILLDSAGRGKDGGIDLIVSKDPLGAGEKIIVQVKHQKGSVGSKELQQLVGTLKPNEYGLMVSTGGITPDAQKYWREQRDRLLKPLEATHFIELLGDVYEKLDSEFKAMLPLKKTYVPVTPDEY